MQAGDLVRLKTPFRPDPSGLEEYQFGIVVSFVETNQKGEKAQGVVLHLYDSQTQTIYCDALGENVLFHFQLDEVEQYLTS